MPRARDGTLIDWGAGIRAAWGECSEAAALSRLDDFMASQLPSYEATRQRADGSGVSRLSPYLRFGQLSPRRVAAALHAAGGAKTSRTFAHRLGWRDLAYWQLHHFPAITHAPLRAAQLAAQPWAPPEVADMRLRAWQRGATGYPLVDAGMRELRRSGWMQQSVRMVAASFLIRVLHVPWQHGLAWFHDNLEDADVAINSMMWANAAGAGLDPWSFELSPVSRHQDPSGAYIRAWLPELRALPEKHTHAPWAAPSEVLAAAGVQLGRTYPERIVVDVAAAAAEHEAGERASRHAAGSAWRDASGYDLVAVPPGVLSAPASLVAGGRMRVFTLPAQRIVDTQANAGDGAAGAAPAQPKQPAPRQQQKRGAPAARAKAKPAAPPLVKRPRRVSLKDAPLVGRDAALRDRSDAELRALSSASLDDVSALEEAAQAAADAAAGARPRRR